MNPPMMQQIVITRRSRARQGIFGLAISQMIIGILSMGLGIGLVAGYPKDYWSTRYLVYDPISAVVAPGIWNGFFFVLVASFGIAAGKRQSKCLDVTYLVLNILMASLFAPMQIGLGGASIGIGTDCHWYDGYGTRINCDSPDWIIVLNSLLVVFGVAEFVITIVASAFGCKITCSRSRTPPKYQPLMQGSHSYPYGTTLPPPTVTQYVETQQTRAPSPHAAYMYPQYAPVQVVAGTGQMAHPTVQGQMRQTPPPEKSDNDHDQS